MTPQHYKRIFELRVIGGSPREISKIIGVPVAEISQVLQETKNPPTYNGIIRRRRVRNAANTVRRKP